MMKRIEQRAVEDTSLPRDFGAWPIFRGQAVISSLFSILFCILLAGCAWLPPSEAPREAAVEPPGERPILVKDERQEVYANVALATIAGSEGNYEEARRYLLEAITRDPESPYLNLKMAVLLKGLKDYKAALVYARKCLDLKPDDIQTHALVADLYALTGEDDLALQEYEKILVLDEKNQRIRLILTTILIRKGAFQQALEQLDTLTDENPELVIPHYYRGRIFLELRRYDEAEEAYKKALALNERLEPALFDLGTLYQMTEKLPEAALIYEKLLQFFPENMAVRERLITVYMKLGLDEKAENELEAIKENSKPGAPERQALGLLYLKHGKVDESIEELNLIVNAWPADHKSRYYLATAYEQKEEVEKALEHFRQIPPDSPYFLNSQVHIAYLLDSRKKHDEAVDVLKKAIALKDDKIELYLMLASIYETKKSYDEAITVLREALTKDNANLELIFRLGVIYDKKGEKEACIAEMRRVLDINPDYSDALNYIGYTYAEQGVQLDEALALIQKALRLKPDSGYIIDSLGWVYYQKGMYDEAEYHLEKAAKLTPNDPTINEHLGDVYFKKTRYRESLEQYKKALALNHPQEEKVRQKITQVEELLRKQN